MKYCPLCTSHLELRLLDQQERSCCTNPDCSYVYWNNPIPVVGIIIETSEGIVLAHNKLMPEGMFSIITGFLEAKESPAYAAERELKEELGLNSISTTLIGAYSIEKANQVLIIYHIEAEGTILLNEELDAYKIVAKEELLGWNSSMRFEVEEWIRNFKVLAD